MATTQGGRHTSTQGLGRLRGGGGGEGDPLELGICPYATSCEQRGPYYAAWSSPTRCVKGQMDRKQMLEASPRLQRRPRTEPK